MVNSELLNFIGSVLGGGVLVAIITPLVSNCIEKKREIRNKKVEKYSNYIRISEQLAVNPTNDVQNQYVQTCAELCIYASKGVLEKIATMHANEYKHKINNQLHDYYETPGGKNEYAEILKIMRKEIANNFNSVTFNVIMDVMQMRDARPGIARGEKK